MTEILNRVGYIRLNKPPVNGYEIHLLQLLQQHIQQMDAEREVKVIVIESALSKFFCAGADIKVFGSNTTEENKQMVVAARKVASTITESAKIFMAVLNGHTLGGGLELAMACDIRLASEGDYLLGLPEIKLGLIPGNGGTIRLMRLVGTGRALELLLSGDTLSPSEALRIGLLNRIFPKTNFEGEVKAWAEKLAKGPGQAMAKIKECSRQMTSLSLNEALAFEKVSVDQLYNTADAQEGFQAYLEKRQPNFE